MEPDTKASARDAATIDRPSGRNATAAPVRHDGFRDTIESIVVAFILAFVFRAFVVEAFIIPTGSMAPGLRGQHGTHRCTACQFPFSYGIRDAVRLADGTVRPGTLDAPGGFAVQCPNCGRESVSSNLNASEASRVVARSGDRILVLKWPFDLGGGLLGPQRWDVVVFKDPQDGETNFIKRLLGLPGEVLEIINGDIYAAPIEDVPPSIIQALSEPPAKPPEGGPRRLRLSRAQHAELAKVLKIQRKPKAAQESLWIIHYDHDYVPNPNSLRSNPDAPEWVARDRAAEAAWDAATPRVRFSPENHREHWLDLAGKPIQDPYGYNSVFRRNLRRSTACDVGDTRLSLVLLPDGTNGYCVLSLRKGRDVFFATIHADGTVQLDREQANHIRTPMQTARIAPLQPGIPLDITFENLDYRATLTIGGEEIVATDDRYRPDLFRILQGKHRDGSASKAAVAIGAKDLPLEIRHLAVHRDVFYRSTDVVLDRYDAMRHVENPWAGYPGWGTQTNPILLRADPPDYFCCGDNSPQSKDSRLWWEVSPTLLARQKPNAYRPGTVPGDQMIGQAFFVYWPSALRFLKETPAVIPNVGRMRIIR